MVEKMGPSKGFKPMEVEVEEIIEEILEEGGLPRVEVNVTRYFVCHEESGDAQKSLLRDGIQENMAVDGLYDNALVDALPQYNQFLKVS